MSESTLTRQKSIRQFFVSDTYSGLNISCICTLKKGESQSSERGASCVFKLFFEKNSYAVYLFVVVDTQIEKLNMKKFTLTLFSFLILGIGQGVFAQDQLEVDGTSTANLRITAPNSKYLRMFEGGTQKAIFGHNGTDIFIRNYETGGDVFIGADGGTDFTIESGGFIGMGTTNPGDNLHIAHPSNADIRMEAGGAKYMRFYEGATQKAFIGHSGTNIVISNLETNGDIFFGVDGGTQEMILETGGEFGIGTLLPEARAHVYNGSGASTADPDNEVDMIIEDNSSAYLEFNGMGLAGITFNDDNTSLRAGYLFNTLNDRLTLRTGGVNDRLIVRETGLIGINDVNPTAMLHIKQSGTEEEGLAIENDTDTDTWAFEIGANDLTLYFNGTDKGRFNDTDGNWIPMSDQRLKNSISDMAEGMLDELIKLQPKTYYFNDDKEMKQRAFGYLAQDVQKVFPDVVVEMDNGSGLLGLDYTKLGVVTVKAVQELNDKVASLENDLAKKDKEIEALKASFEQRLAKLEAAQK